MPRRLIILDDDPVSIGKFLEASKTKKEREEKEEKQIKEVEDTEAEDEHIWFEMTEKRSQEEERCRQTELRENYDQTRGVYYQLKEANSNFLSNLIKLRSIHVEAHREWHSMGAEADKVLGELVKDIVTCQRFLRAARYTPLLTKLGQLQASQKEIVDHIRMLAEIAKYRMLFWLYHIERLKEEEGILSSRSHPARQPRQRSNTEADRTPIRRFVGKLTSPFNRYVDNMEDLEKDFRPLFSWNPPSPSRTRATYLPLHTSRLEAEDPDKMLRQSPLLVLDIMKQSKTLARNARSIKLSRNLEERLILIWLATRPLVEQYLYLHFDIPLRKFVNKAYTIDKEYGKFRNGIDSLFVKRAGHMVPDYMQRLVDDLSSLRWKFIRGTASFMVHVKNEVYKRFLRPNMQERLEARRDDIIKEREEGQLQTNDNPKLVATKSRKRSLRAKRWHDEKRNTAAQPTATNDSAPEDLSGEAATHANVGTDRFDTASIRKITRKRDDKPMRHMSTDESSGSVKLSSAFQPSPSLKSAHVQAMSLTEWIDEEEQSEADTEKEISNGDHAPLVYHIPDDVLRQAMHASTSSIAAYWSHKLYRGPHGEHVLVQYCRSKQLAENVAQQFANKKILGFDIEWKPNAKSTDGIKANVSLIQLASEDRIGLFHLALYKGDTAEEIMPPTLRQIIESADILKSGVAVKGDSSRLKTYLGIEAKGLVELSHIHNLVKFSTSDPKKVNKRLVSLATQVHEHLQLPLYKGAVRTSDWSKPLDHEQSAYAAADAYASFRLFDALEAKRLSLKPVPPRPACVEDDQPITFPGGMKVDLDNETSSTELEDESEDTDQYPGAFSLAGSVEDPDLVYDSDESSAQRYTQMGVKTPADQVDAQNDRVSSSKYETTPTAATLDVRTASVQCDSNAANYVGCTRFQKADTLDQGQLRIKQPQLLQAEAWVAEWKNNHLLNSSKPRVTSAALRAYALWYYQSLDVDNIASLMREPPLRKSTVSTYILECLLLEHLPFNKAKAKLLFNDIPWPVQGRYDSIRRKLQR